MEDMYEHLDPSLVYASTSIPGIGCPELFDEEFLEGCTCKNTMQCCNACDCTCTKGNESFYDENLRVKWPLPSYPIFECNPKCLCSKVVCKNTVIQRGPIQDLSINFISSDKGFGLFCKNKIVKGTFVCTYSGEIIGLEEGRRRTKIQQDQNKPNYILFVKEVFSIGPLSTVIDPSTIGNIGRYCNHSCDPNLIMIPIRVQNLIPHLSLFATKDIPENTELTFDYGNPSTSLDATQFITSVEFLTNEEKSKLIRCLCDAKEKCRKYLPYHREGY